MTDIIYNIYNWLRDIILNNIIHKLDYNPNEIKNVSQDLIRDNEIEEEMEIDIEEELNYNNELYKRIKNSNNYIKYLFFKKNLNKEIIITRINEFNIKDIYIRNNINYKLILKVIDNNIKKYKNEPENIDSIIKITKLTDLKNNVKKLHSLVLYEKAVKKEIRDIKKIMDSEFNYSL